MELSLNTNVTNNYCTICVEIDGLSRLDFPDAIHFLQNKKCILFLTLWYDKPPILQLSHFFNLIQQQHLKSPTIITDKYLKLLKGSGQTLLCWTLKELIKLNLIHENHIITLEAGGDENTEEQIKQLILYYKQLGFKESDPSLPIDYGYPMEARVKNIIDLCIVKNKLFYEFLQSQPGLKNNI